MQLCVSIRLLYNSPLYIILTSAFMQLSQIIDRLIDETVQYGFKSICIPPMYLQYARDKVKDKTFLLCTVAGFPIGYDHVEAKLASLRQSADLGADEIDVVINLSAAKTGHW